MNALELVPGWRVPLDLDEWENRPPSALAAAYFSALDKAGAPLSVLQRAAKITAQVRAGEAVTQRRTIEEARTYVRSVRHRCDPPTFSLGGALSDPCPGCGRRTTRSYNEPTGGAA